MHHCKVIFVYIKQEELLNQNDEDARRKIENYPLMATNLILEPYINRNI